MTRTAPFDGLNLSGTQGPSAAMRLGLASAVSTPDSESPGGRQQAQDHGAFGGTLIAGIGAQNPEPLFRSSRAALADLSFAGNLFNVVEPQINAQGVHVWPFDVSCPLDVLFLRGDRRHHVRMNRHGYFEVLYLCSGFAECRIEDQALPFREGDLAVLGGSLYHSIECRSSDVTIAALFFEPDLIRCDGGSDSAEYLTPFLLQDSKFPPIVPAATGVPDQVLNMMLRIRSEFPAITPRARLAVGTYLKMLLMFLVNHYASRAETAESLQREQYALDRFLPVFRFLGKNCGNAINVQAAARLCGMSESYFMSFFKRINGLTFVEYLNRCRIERAQALLLSTDESIACISREVGYCDQSYFGAVFRKAIGITPATYRRRFRLSRSGEPGAADGATLKLPGRGRKTT
jgi:AraC-like DNA-binding protein